MDFAKVSIKNTTIINLIFQENQLIIFVIPLNQIYGVLKEDMHFDILYMTCSKMTQ